MLVYQRVPCHLWPVPAERLIQLLSRQIKDVHRGIPRGRDKTRGIFASKSARKTDPKKFWRHLKWGKKNWQLKKKKKRLRNVEDLFKMRSSIKIGDHRDNIITNRMITTAITAILWIFDYFNPSFGTLQPEIELLTDVFGVDAVKGGHVLSPFFRFCVFFLSL